MGLTLYAFKFVVDGFAWKPSEEQWEFLNSHGLIAADENDGFTVCPSDVIAGIEVGSEDDGKGRPKLTSDIQEMFDLFNNLLEKHQTVVLHGHS
jgi:hypothetical protein